MKLTSLQSTRGCDGEKSGIEKGPSVRKPAEKRAFKITKDSSVIEQAPELVWIGQHANAMESASQAVNLFQILEHQPMTLHTYLPQDRFRALVRGTTLPDRTSGSALFADISGFTPLTEKLTRELGARRGIDELTLRINSVYDALICEVDRFGGSIISFAGDAITCWFDSSLNEPSIRAFMCAMQISLQNRACHY